MNRCILSCFCRLSHIHTYIFKLENMSVCDVIVDTFSDTFEEPSCFVNWSHCERDDILEDGALHDTIH